MLLPPLLLALLAAACTASAACPTPAPTDVLAARKAVQVHPSALDELAGALRTWCEACPEQAGCWTELGYVLERTHGRLASLDEVSDVFAKAAAIEPRYRFLQVKMLARAGRLDEALELLAVCEPSASRRDQAACIDLLRVEWVEVHFILGRAPADLLRVLREVDFDAMGRVVDHQAIRGLFLRARAEDMLGQTDAALETLRDMNERNCDSRAVMKGLPPKRIEELFQADVRGLRFYLSSRSFSQRLEAAQGRQSSDARRQPVFVVGLPRSGTTLLESLLAQHPAIAGAGESFAAEVLLGARPCLTRDDGQPTLCPVNTRMLDDDNIDNLRERYLRELLRDAAAQSQGRDWDSVRFVVDKLLINWARIPLLRLAFPRAVVVHAQRNMSDTVLSNLMQPFADPVLACSTASPERLARYVAEYKTSMAAWRRVAGVTWIDIHYETLVEAPEREVGRVLSALGLDPMRIDPASPASPAGDTVFTASREQVRKPLYSSSVGRAAQYGPALHLGHVCGEPV